MSLQRAVFVLCLLLPACVMGQARYDANWTFGEGAGLHFNVDGTVSTFETDADNLEACATISDPSGNIMFYLSDCTLNDYACIETDSSVSLINGDSIYSHRSITNGAVFIPIDSTSIHLLHIAFNLDSLYSPTRRIIFNLYSSKLSKVGNNLWEVTDKNTLISPIGIEEKLVVIKHANGNDWWILVHEDSGIDRQCSNSKLVFFIVKVLFKHILLNL